MNFDHTDAQVASVAMTDVLTHWTGRAQDDLGAFEILRTICAERVLRLTYCPTYVRAAFRPRISMVCFTDVPLNESASHCLRFGRSGIAFKKDTLLRYGANPVLYTTSAHFDRILALSALLDRMIDEEKDREWKAEIKPYSFEENETLALLEVLGFLQDYAYQGRDDADAVNYSQREWRLTFQTLPFAGGDSVQEPGTSCFYVRQGVSYPTVAFGPQDVSYLVAPRRLSTELAVLAADIGVEARVFEDYVEAPSK